MAIGRQCTQDSLRHRLQCQQRCGLTSEYKNKQAKSEHVLLSSFIYRLLRADMAQTEVGSPHIKRSRLKVGFLTSNDLI